jgi:formate dehydrogenase subunit gamma
LTDRAARIAEICAEHAALEGPLLPILHAVQAEFACVDADAEREVAQTLNLSRADVHGVVSFYHDFAAEPDHRPEVQICRAEACQARGVDAIVSVAEHAAADRVRITTVYCLGLCSVGPCARIGNLLHARLDEAAVLQLVQSA